MPFLESHRTVHAFLDNDESGRKAVARMEELLPKSEVIDQSKFYRNHKDLNDYLKRIEAEGRLGQWCDDNIEWLRKTYGAENLVSAVLHLDEATVQGEFRN